MKLLSRKFLQGGREEVRLEIDGAIRLGRIFRTPLVLEEAARSLELLRDLAPEGQVLVPDRVEPWNEDALLVSLEVEDSGSTIRTPFPAADLLAPVRALHAAGLCCLDLASAPFIPGASGPRLVLWADVLLSGGSGDLPPELAAGGFCTPASDYWQLGRMLQATRGHLWEPLAGDPLPEGLSSPLLSKRISAALSAGLEEASAVRLPSRHSGRLPRSGVMLLEGGDWRERDALVNSWVCQAAARGWPARVVRCRPPERRRPLPGRRPGGPPVSSAADLIGACFPGVSGIGRLLVINDAEYASPDLAAMLREFSELSPPNLSLVISSAERFPEVRREGSAVVELPGGGEAAMDEVPGGPAPGSWPEPCWYGLRIRTDASAPAGSDEAPDMGVLFEEGGYREIASAMERMEVPPSASILAAKSLLALGRYEAALEVEPDADPMLRARCLAGLGRGAEAEENLRMAAAGGHGGSEAVLLLAGMMADSGRLAEAETLLSSLDQVDSAPLLSRVLDMQGRPAEALSLLSGALQGRDGAGKVELLCSRVNILMRLGFYEDAAGSADQAVLLSRSGAHFPSLRRSLLERGRVREVTGLWREALQDYRLAVLYAAEGGEKQARPPSVDLFVLELRMGLITDAFETLDKLSRELPSAPGTTSAQLMDSLHAVEGVYLGRGARSLEFAERGASAAARLGMPLRQGLCLLYRGQLLLQEGEKADAAGSLRNARAIAGLLGDRHLALLVDLASLQAGLEEVSPGSVGRAVELGLPIESDEARVLTAGPVREFRDAIGRLLALPSPLRACELASSRPGKIDQALRRQLLEARSAIVAMLDGDDAESFCRLTAGLSSPSGMAAPASFEEAVLRLAGWFSESAGAAPDPSSLRQAMGLDQLSLEEPPGGSCERFDCPGGPLYASGGDSPAISALAPVLAELLRSAISPESPPEQGRGSSFPEIIGASAAIAGLKRSMEKVSVMEAPVLIVGETGTGKELAARGIHMAGPRRDMPFVPVDCGAIPEGLLESELFGARKGAYTDSRTDRQGLLEASSGGTLFLDEIGNLPMSLQAKLLRALETGRVRRVGDTAETPVDLRLIAATNSDPLADTAAGRFRADLYYRIAVMIIEVPPLRDRREDIPLLAGEFAGRASGGRSPAFSRGAMRKLQAHSWPGNVRELRNVVQRAVLLGDGGTVREEDIVFAEGRPGGPASPANDLETAMARHVHGVLEACGGNRSQAAAILRCDPKTLRKYLRIYAERG